MYHSAIRQFIRTLQSLDTWLVKAEQHAAQRKFDVNNLLSARLAPDMLPFVVQVRIACDSAKAAAANLAQKESPKHPDDEKTVEELHARIAKCVAYLEGFRPEDFAKTTEKTVIAIPYPEGKALLANDYLFSRQIPNFFFHVMVAYCLLRNAGVELGKVDFYGKLDFVER